MSTLYIHLPHRTVADSAPLLLALACPFAEVSASGRIEREGVEPLSLLSELIARMQRVVLLLDGSNVTLLRLKVPPLSTARLAAALPNLVEEQLLCDPAECVIVAGCLFDGMRTLAIMQRAWLELLYKTFSAFRARHIAVLPAQLCLPYQSGQKDSVTAALNERDAHINISLRLSEQEGIGLVIDPISSVIKGVNQNDSTAHEAIRTLCAVAPTAQIALYVPPSLVNIYQEAANLTKRISILADNWPIWIEGARVTTIDLMTGLGTRAFAQLDWHPWRWSLALTASVALINVIALNIDWWRMQDESNTLSMQLIQIYKSAYPKESVILDPVVQMQQKYVSAKRNSGLVAPDDFMTITAFFGEAWISMKPTTGKQLATIAALEYHEHSLSVHFKPGGEVPAQEMKVLLAKRGFSLEMGGLKPSASEQSGSTVWQIRSAK